MAGAGMIAVAVIAAGIAAVASWFVAARLGLRWAIGLPLVAVAGFLFKVWHFAAMPGDAAQWLVVMAALVALPVLAGAAIGIGLHLWRRKTA